MGSIPSSLIVCNILQILGIMSLMNVWQNSPVKSSRARIFFVGKFLTTNSIFSGKYRVIQGRK